jgi:hypothetical protein
MIQRPLTPEETQELREAFVHKKLTKEQQLEVEETFNMFDVGGAGFINYGDVKSAIAALGYEPKVVRIQQVVSSGMNSVVIFDDFLVAMTKMILHVDPDMFIVAFLKKQGLKPRMEEMPQWVALMNSKVDVNGIDYAKCFRADVEKMVGIELATTIGDVDIESDVDSRGIASENNSVLDHEQPRERERQAEAEDEQKHGRANLVESYWSKGGPLAGLCAATHEIISDVAALVEDIALKFAGTLGASGRDSRQTQEPREPGKHLDEKAGICQSVGASYSS